MPLALASVLLAASAAAIDIDATDRTALDDAPLIAPLGTRLPKVTVAWIDPEGSLTDAGDAAMVEEVEAVFGSIGIETEVVSAAPGQPIAAGDGMVVPVVARRRQPSSVRPDRVMGLVLRDHVAPSPAWIFMDNVRATLGGGATAGELGRAVGRVVAHEVIHALAPSHPHASGGLMAPTLGRLGLLGRRRPPDPGCVRAVLAGILALSTTRPAPAATGLARNLLR
jgi:hypothetical protein